MYLSFVQLYCIRNFENISFEPCSALNIIYGNNGAGKSSVLEAIHLLGYGRTFRTNRQNSLIQHNCESGTVFSRLIDDDKVEHKLGCTRHRVKGFEFSKNGERSKKLSDIVKKVPMQIFTPQSSDLIIGQPMVRRRFLDWALFHVKHGFSDLVNAYLNTLKQRNAMLKKAAFGSRTSNKSQFDFWTDSLAHLGEMISRERNEYVESLNEAVVSLNHQFLPEFTIELRYNKGWEKGVGCAKPW